MGEIIDFNAAGKKRKEEQRRQWEDELIVLLNEYRGMHPICMDWVYHARMLEEAGGDGLYETGMELRTRIWSAIDELSAHLVNGDYDGRTIAAYDAGFKQTRDDLSGFIRDVREAREDR